MINLQLYYEIYKLREGAERYCFPLRRFLGDNGLYENHELKGRTFRKKEGGKLVTVDDVYVHWYNGWYFLALARDENNSHFSITWNINCQVEGYSIEDFELVEPIGN